VTGSKEARERSGEVCQRRGLTVEAKSRRGDAANKAKQTEGWTMTEWSSQLG
jgi:hypothetical protein